MKPEETVEEFVGRKAGEKIKVRIGGQVQEVTVSRNQQEKDKVLYCHYDVPVVTAKKNRTPEFWKKYANTPKDQRPKLSGTTDYNLSEFDRGSTKAMRFTTIVPLRKVIA